MEVRMDSAAHHGYGGNSRFLKRHMVSPREKTEQIDTVRKSGPFSGLLRSGFLNRLPRS